MDSEAGAFLTERELRNELKIESPELLYQLLSDKENLASNFKEKEARLVFRGQPNRSHGLNPSLYRAILEKFETSAKSRKLTEALINRIEISLLKAARAEGLGRNLSDVNLLALLQHHGIPTRLLDVSKDPLVALYFSVNKEDGEDGRLFIISAKDKPLLDPQVKPHSLFAGLPWGSSRAGLQPPIKQWTQKVQIPVLSFQDARMKAQQAEFLVGGLASPSGKFQQYRKISARKPLSAASFREITTLMIRFPAKFSPKTSSGGWYALAWSIEIPAAWKPKIRELLKAHRPPINQDSLFPPLGETNRLLISEIRHAIDALP